MTMDPVHDIVIGSEVYTADGHKLGIVKELEDEALKVDASLQPDYWLARAAVLSFTNERVTMEFERDTADEHKLDRPSDAEIADA